MNRARSAFAVPSICAAAALLCAPYACSSSGGESSSANDPNNAAAERGDDGVASEAGSEERPSASGSITRVELDATRFGDSRQVPQGFGQLRVVVNGSRLASAVGATLGESPCVVASAAEDTLALDCDVVHGAGIGLRALVVALSDGVVRAERVVEVTRITVHDPANVKDLGIGTPQQPFRSLTKALALAGKGDVVALGRGRYESEPAFLRLSEAPETSKKTNVRDGVTIEGETAADGPLVTIAAAGDYAYPIVFAGSGQLRNLTFDGFVRAVSAQHGTVNMEDVSIANATDAGVYAAGDVSMKIRGTRDNGCIARGSATGFQVTGAAQVDIDRCAVLGANVYGVLAQDRAKVSFGGASSSIRESGSSLGAGARVEGDASLTLANVVLSANRGPAALVADRATLMIRGATVDANVGATIGSAAASIVSLGGTLSISSSSISNTTQGRGIYCGGARCSLDTVKVSEPSSVAIAVLPAESFKMRKSQLAAGCGGFVGGAVNLLTQNGAPQPSLDFGRSDDQGLNEFVCLSGEGPVLGDYRSAGTATFVGNRYTFAGTTREAPAGTYTGPATYSYPSSTTQLFLIQKGASLTF